MKWADFLIKLQELNGKVTEKGDNFTIVEFTIEGNKEHLTLQIEDKEAPIDNTEVTRILNRFKISEMLFRGHH